LPVKVELKKRDVTMLKRLMLALPCALLLLSALTAQEEKAAKKILKNADVVLMTQNHFDDETLVKIIEVSDTDFDISGDALIAMKQQGVSSAVLRAMLASVAKKKAAQSPPASTAVETSASASQPAASSAPSEKQATTAEKPDSNFATRTDSPTPESAPPAPVSSSPAPMAATQFPGMRGSPGMAINPQQLAMMQSQMASMGMGGMMGSMGMGSMFGGMSMGNYSPEQMPHVLLKLPGTQGKQEISASTAQIGQTNFKGGMGAGGMALRSLATEGLSFASMGAGPAGMMAMSAFSMASGFMPGMRPGAPKMTYVWGLPGRKSARELNDSNPMFELSYGDIPGVDPDAYEPTVLKLVQSKDNYRLVGATQLKMTAKNMRNGGGPENGKWISEQRWPCHVSKEERGFYVLHVDSQLEPGEYAVVLRPVKGYKATPSGLGGHAQVFYSVWDFSIPGATEEPGKKKKKK
jgi:hypothetical protein